MKDSNIKIPNHVGIIMDGNGRWATSRGLSRSMGHKAGAENLETLANYIFSKGVKVLSLFVFSTENFKRSQEEVDFLMNMIVSQFKKLSKKYQKSNIKIVFSGRREPLREDVLYAMDEMTRLTENHQDHILNFCINYGGHIEIIDAAKKIHLAIINGDTKIEDICEDTFSKYLYQDLPAIDFVIRTSGEERISNFMLWQASYAEFYFPEIYFPDFNEKAFDQSLIVYTSRDRRFGGVVHENENY